MTGIADAKDLTDMRARIKERSELAHFYACDGAYRSAARILRELTEEVEAHVVRSEVALSRLIGSGD